MTKLAIFSALLLGACVADQADSTPRVQTADVTAINVIDEAEIPTVGSDHIDPTMVIVTGVEDPTRISTGTHVDIGTVITADPTPETRSLCTFAASLPGSHVCSSLCQPSTFAARLSDQGGANPGGCLSTTCPGPGSSVINVDVCSSTK